MMDFSGAAGAGSSTDLIPNGQLAFAIITYRGLKASKTPNEKTGQYGQYLDLELTIDAGQPFERRKVWTRIMDPMHAGNSDDAKQMGMASISRILEAGRNAGPQNPGGYQIASYDQMDGLRCAIKIKIAKGENGYADKNEVAEFLSPNPASASNKAWQKLTSGVFNLNGGGAQAPQGSFGFAAPAATAPAPQAGFGFAQQPAAQQQQQTAPQTHQNTAAQPTAWNQQGGAVQGTNVPFQGHTAPVGAAGVQSMNTGVQVNPAAAQNATSPSNPAALQPSGWLAQANMGQPGA